MSISRCLGTAMRALGDRPRAEWGAYLDRLPERCPHGDCTAEPGCREYVASYFRLQWRLAVRRESRVAGR